MNENEVRRQMVMQIGRVLASESCLRIIDLLMERPRTPEELQTDLQLNEPDVQQALAEMRQAGLLLRQEPEERQICLSPFGVYGARTAVDQVLATTHEDGACAKCGGCR